jgi:hypothetical protein
VAGASRGEEGTYLEGERWFAGGAGSKICPLDGTLLPGYVGAVHGAHAAWQTQPVDRGDR